MITFDGCLDGIGIVGVGHLGCEATQVLGANGVGGFGVLLEGKEFRGGGYNFSELVGVHCVAGRDTGSTSKGMGCIGGGDSGRQCNSIGLGNERTVPV